LERGTIDLSRIKTYPIAERHNLVKRSDFIANTRDFPVWQNRNFLQLVRRVIRAAKEKRQIIVMMGGHVVKSGLSLLIIDLMKRGVITHVAGNGSVSIHDFEMALIGETSEYVPRSIEDGSFGMAEETGRFMNEAINCYAEEGMGYAIGRWIVEHNLPYQEYSILANAYRLGIPVTIHVAIGTDIIHQHPACDGARTGLATYTDFKMLCHSVAHMKEGCYLNFGSAVIGPEVFLKALSIARNLGYQVHPITTANFDLRRGLNDYFYRPSKNIVVRPTSLGGRGFNLRVDHKVSIPSLHRLVVEALEAT
jgi:deoxyhypusine synthase